jgi:hypothetical protein
MGAAGGLGHQLGGQGGQDPGLIFGLGRQQTGGPFGLEVQHRPQGGRDVQGVQAQVVGLPARGQGGGQVAVAGPVDLLDPGAEPGQGFGAAGGREFPPRRGRVGLVAVGFVGLLGRQAGEFGELGGEGGEVAASRASSWMICSWWAASWSNIAGRGSAVT